MKAVTQGMKSCVNGFSGVMVAEKMKLGNGMNFDIIMKSNRQKHSSKPRV